MAAAVSHTALTFKRQLYAVFLKNCIDSHRGVKHLWEPYERSRKINHLTQFFRRNSNIECGTGVGFKLGYGLLYGKSDAGNHFTLFHGKVASLEHFAEDEFLQYIHHFRVCALPCQRLGTEQLAVIPFASIYPIHLFCCLSYHRQAAYNDESHYS